MNTSPAPDRIFLRGLAVDCTIGFIDWERRVKQTVVIDLEMAVDCRRAAIRDNVADTLNYKTVAKRLIRFVEESGFNLVETLVERIAALVLDEFGVAWVRVTVSKPGAIRGSREVGVTIERTRADLATREGAASA
jgi:7,8-dihydroneopterin aldolase/epimerase/oxygenase